MANSRGSIRAWTALTCPRCAGLVGIEHSRYAVAIPSIISVIPEGGRSTDVGHLPEDVAAYYLDAIRALDAGLPDAAAVELRRTLEAAAAHFGQNQGPLVQRVQGLISDGLVTKLFGDVLQEVRRIGNLGAHATDERVNEEEAGQALRFTTQVLRNLFEIPAELELLRKDQQDPFGTEPPES